MIGQQATVLISDWSSWGTASPGPCRGPAPGPTPWRPFFPPLSSPPPAPPSTPSITADTATSSCCLLLPSTPPPAPPPPPPPPPRPPAAGAPPLLRQPPRRRLTPRTLSRPAANGRRRAGVWSGSPRGLDSGASRRETGLLPRSLPSFPPSSTSSYWSDTVLGELLLARHRLKAVGPMREQGGGWRNT